MDISLQSETCTLQEKPGAPCAYLTDLGMAGHQGKAAPRSSDWAEMERMIGVSEVCKVGTRAAGAAPGRGSQREKILERRVFSFVKGGR